MAPPFFADQLAFRAWLERNHATKTELVVGFYKVGTGKPSMTWSESVDQALCFGWIDGVRRSLDAERYTIRFTPRKPTSAWSAINVRKVAELTKQGLMRAAGIEIFRKRKTEHEKGYSFEGRAQHLPAGFEKVFKSNRVAWDFFAHQAPSYQRTIIHWITTAKREVTQLSRLDKVIATSAKKKRIF
jgi:uncharacterized protein YdeI (YjbR/CyaY-like superfamily)